MTTPPPSEGPSPEALFERFMSDWKELPNIDPEASAEEDSIEIAKVAELNAQKRAELYRLVSAAKRSAHLEDARAGCAHCGQGLVPVHDVVDGWVHDEDGADCKRPEVWDALSLPPGGPSGTIKSAASEQPAGKTR